MNNKFNIIILILGCFTLMSCPPGHYYRYEYIGGKSLGTKDHFTLLEFNNISDIRIECGFYYMYAGDKERGLGTRIGMSKNDKFDLTKANVKVKSSKLGELIKRELPIIANSDSTPTLIFEKKIDIKRERKILRLIKNDTITIEFDNGIKYQFVKK